MPPPVVLEGIGALPALGAGSPTSPGSPLAAGDPEATLGFLDEEKPEPVEVPYTELSAEALHGLMQEFVTRDGTDYGVKERPLASKLAQLRTLLERGEARVVFDPETGTANIVVAV